MISNQQEHESKKEPIREIAEKNHNRLDPKNDEKYDLYSFSAYDDNQQTPIETPGSEINSAKYVVPSQSVLISKLNPRINRVWKVEDAESNAICSTEFIVLQPSENTTLDYLYAVLNDPSFRSHLTQLTTGTSGSHQRVKQTDILDYEISKFNKAEKKVVSSIYGKLDKKIEINNQINGILEEIAQALFKSWFVDFEPYKEFKQSELGEIPESFEVKSIKEITENYDQKRDPVKQKIRKENDDIYPYYGAVRPLGYMEEYIFDGKYLLVAEDGTNSFPDGYPVTQFVNEKFWASNHVHVVKGKGKVTTEFVNWLLANTNVKPYLTGSVQPKLNQSNLNSINVAIPPQDKIQEFTQLVKPVHKLIWQHDEQNEKLSSIRDALLPKLMSGEIRVNDIELDELEVDSEV